MRQCSLRSPFAEAVGRGRPNPALEMINRTLISEPSVRTDDLIVRMERAGILAQRRHIGGSLAASRESLDILREFGALSVDDPSESLQPQPQNDDKLLQDHHLSRILAAIKHDVATSGMGKTGVNPFRLMPTDSDMRSMLRQIWDEQNGKCSFCGKPIPLETTNKLLQISRDRTD